MTIKKGNVYKSKDGLELTVEKNFIKDQEVTYSDPTGVETRVTYAQFEDLLAEDKNEQPKPPIENVEEEKPAQFKMRNGETITVIEATKKEVTYRSSAGRTTTIAKKQFDELTKQRHFVQL